MDLRHSTFHWQHDRYVFTVFSATGDRVRRIGVDRRDLVVVSMSEYDASGRRVTMFRLRGHAPPAEPEDWGGRLARRVQIERPRHEVRATVRLGTPKVRDGVPASFFACRAPAGWRRINLDSEPIESVEFFRRGSEERP
jgi:hypothetical protein